MKKGLLTLGDKQYYLNEKDGILTPNIAVIDGKKFFIDNEGNRHVGWKKIGLDWYYFSKEDGMKTGWVKDGVWYYLNGSGAMQTGWQKVDGTWYYLNSSGAMQTGWINQGGTWYYLAGSGAMRIGWYQVSGKWYYSYPSGALAVNTTIDGYTVNANGEWM